MVFVILNGLDWKSVQVVTDIEGNNEGFDTEEKAEQYAKENLNFKSKVIEW